MAHFGGIIRPNIRPNIRLDVAEYSVSADTTFRPIGRSLALTLMFKMADFAHLESLKLISLEI